MRDRIRVFNKYVTNRVLRGLAVRGIGPFAFVGHVGRRSGKPYETMIMVWPASDGFIIALTYGPDVDWLRNLLAASGGTITWHRRRYAVGKPERIDSATALRAFPAPFKLILGTFRRHEQFVHLKSLDPAPAKA